MAASEELFGEGYPGAFTRQPEATTRPGQLSEFMFPLETEQNAHFTVSLENPTTNPTSELSPEEDLADKLVAVGHMLQSRGKLADRFRLAGHEAIANAVDARTESEAQRRERDIQSARDALAALYPAD